MYSSARTVTVFSTSVFSTIGFERLIMLPLIAWNARRQRQTTNRFMEGRQPQYPLVPVSPNGKFEEKSKIEQKYWWFICPEKDRIHEAHLLYKNDEIIPHRKPDGSPTRGVYAWYFHTAQLQIRKKDYFVIDNFKLLYVGIAGAKNKPNSKATLRSRILGDHLRKNAFGSSLRFSLGTLLQKHLTLKLMPYGSKGFKWSNENALTDWMIDNALVTWIEHATPWEIEEEIIHRFGAKLPLNYKGNEENSVAANLHEMKKKFRRQIREERAGTKN